MRDFEKTIENMTDKLKTAFVGSIDSEGYPNIKNYASAEEKRRHSSFLFLHQHVIFKSQPVS